ncbi:MULTISPECIES: DUF3311 domain-containing protein [unclassified Sporosarcina]|uniref:DUF3311 domain-containing protein n=1 Tax=unclassified Sporosarcina TaxID=2647733 RepID=UPI002040ADF9|nr:MULTISPECIES: DUF3311 domain-containing protein [unclassified Sporosarcina]GKV65871.1 hypothetical protein NCCP2331_20240 [Sporosarcina sp. NCCP-2331]GLB55996.1 hypothetical protein NCCP2378_17830 [Sporosarcina sp. NCCP-2378]
MTRRTALNVFIGLVIPFVGIVSGILVFRNSEQFVLGFPILYFWMFLWFILTSICISMSWFFFDSKDPEIEWEE